MYLIKLRRLSDLCLVLEIFTDLSSCEVPDLNEAINGASDEVLTIRREPCTLHVSLLSELSKKPNTTKHDEWLLQLR